jgi:4-hydroxybenzoate polyprenyltransferase
MCKYVQVNIFLAMRPRHWLKNLLILVAPLGAAALTPNNVGAILGAFLGFSLTASATYLVNDVADRHRDRAHPHKQHRAIAAGRVHVAAALAVAGVLLVVAGIVSWLVSPAFLAVVAAYLVATILYSFWLKTAPAVDIVMLALFFVLRIIAGGIAVEVAVSSWLLATSFFVFLSIAAAKRVIELKTMRSSTDAVFVGGRGYLASDHDVVLTAGVGSGIASALLLGLYLESGSANLGLEVPQLMWLAIPLWIYWLLRFWIFVSRDKVNHDPVEFVLKDWVSYMTVTAMAALVYLAQ